MIGSQTVALLAILYELIGNSCCIAYVLRSDFTAVVRSEHRCKPADGMAALYHKSAFAGALGQSAVSRAPRVQRAQVQICASFKNKENIDLSHVTNYAQHEKDVGSAEVQIARLTARVQQISSHLKVNRKDFGSKRGLEAVLSQRKRLMRYLYKTNRSAYDRVVVELGLRSVVAGDTHKAQQKAAVAAQR